MYAMILRLAWPYLIRFATSQAANYLEQRRERRAQPKEQPNNLAECPPCPPCPPTAESNAEDEQTTGFFWYALSGLLLGSAFSLMLYVLLQDDKARL